jgi:type II secretory pathway pseudopilin PulG
VLIRKAQGFALIDLIFVCGIIGLLSSIALPRMLMAQQAAGASSAIGSLRTISSAQLTYALTCGSGFYAPDLPTLGVTPPGSNEPYIAPGLSGGMSVTRSSYIIQMEGTPYAGAPPTCNGLGAGAAAQGFRAGADPTFAGNSRFFAVNSNATIFEHNATLYPSMPEVGPPPIGQILR